MDKINTINHSSMYVRIMKPETLSSAKFEVQVSLMGLLMDKFVSRSRDEAASWLLERSLRGGYDKLTLEVISEEKIGYV